MCVRTFALLLLALLAGVAARPARAQEKVTYDDQVQRVFTQHCGRCHGDDKQKAGLNLASYAGVLKGSSGGAVVQSGDPENSVLFLAITHRREPTMPPGANKIPERAIATIRAWIEGGLLENGGSQAKPKRTANPALAAIVVSTERPATPPPLPEDLLLEPVVVTARPGAIVALAASPWAPLVAVGGQHQVLLYDTRSLELLGVLPFPEGLPHALSFTRDGRLLVAGGGRDGASGRVVAWNVQDGARVVAVGEEGDAPLAADLSSDRRFVALGGSDKVVKLLASGTGELLHTLKKHTEWITALAFSPDGVLLATGDRNGGLVVWESQSGREYQTLLGPTAAITAVAWRDDGNVLAAASEDGSVRLFEMFEGKEIKNVAAHPGGALAVAMAHDGRLATCGRDRMVKLWSADGQPLRTFETMDDVALEVAFDADGGRVIAGDWTGAIRVWNAADGARVGSLLLAPPRVDDRLASAQVAAASARQQLDAAAIARAAAEVAVQAPLAELAAARAAAAPFAEKTRAAEQRANEARAGAEAVAAALTAAAQELEARRAAAAAQVQLVADAEGATSASEGSLRAAEQVEADRKSLAAKMAEAAAAMRSAAAAAPDDAALQEAAARAEEAAAKAQQSHAGAQQALATAATQRSAALHALDEVRAHTAATADAARAAELHKGEQSTLLAAAGAKQAEAETELQAARNELAPLEQQTAARAAAAKPFEEALAVWTRSAEQAALASAAAQHEVAHWRAARTNLELHAARAELAAAEARLQALAAAAGVGDTVEAQRAWLAEVGDALRGFEAFHELLLAQLVKRPADRKLARLVEASARQLTQSGEALAAARAAAEAAARVAELAARYASDKAAAR